MASQHSQPDPGCPDLQQRIALCVLSLGMTLLGLYVLEDFVRALVWAGVFAIALHPLYRRAERRWPPAHHNILLPFLFTLLVTMVFVAPLIVLAIRGGQEYSTVVAMAVDYQRTGIPVPEAVGRLPRFGQQAATWWRENLSDPAQLKLWLGHIDHDRALSYSRLVGSSIMHRATLFTFSMVALFFAFRDSAELAGQMERGAERAFGLRGHSLGVQIVASVHGTVNGLVLVGLGEGLLLGFGYMLAGVPHAILFGAATAVAAMVPFGAPVVFLVVSLVLLAQGSVGAAIAITVGGFVVGFVADHAIRPQLIGGATQLPFIWVLLGILGGVETFGLLGLFVGPAVMSALILLWREWSRPPVSAPATVLVGPSSRCP
jgi:predicted PurR-regulated permease PerM